LSTPPSTKRPSSVIVSEVSDAEATQTGNEAVNKKKRVVRKKKKRARVADDIDSEGMHHDVNVVNVDDRDLKVNKINPTADTKHFFKAAPHQRHYIKPHSICIPCEEAKGHHKQVLISDTTTLRRHMAYLHPKTYRKWCKENDFESMLPEDAKARRAEVASTIKQTVVDEHFSIQKPEDKPKSYSDVLFEEAAIQWLIETDQPIQAFDHPTFKHMIEVAARATRGVKIPGRKQTRQAIINMFKKQMQALRDRLNSKVASGEVSLTCDAWQASTADGYFAVTGHWIEETPSDWTLEHALFGFTQMNTAHDGVRLGQALFKICD
jgi:hypothetical protein